MIILTFFIKAFILIEIIVVSLIFLLPETSDNTLEPPDFTGVWEEYSEGSSNLILFDDSTFLANNMPGIGNMLKKDSLLINGEWKYCAREQGYGVVGHWYLSYDSYYNRWEVRIYSDYSVGINFEARRVFRYGIFPTDEYELVYIIDVDYMTEKVYRKKCSIADYNPSE